MLQSSKARFLTFLKIGGLISILSISGLLLVGTLSNLLCYRSKLFSPVRLIPSTESIGHEYLQAVIQKNRNYVVKDHECVHGQLLQDIDRYGGAEVKNIVVIAQWNSGNSDSQFEVTSIKFDHRSAVTPSWRSSEIRLLTATNMESTDLLGALPFRRIHCAEPGV